VSELALASPDEAARLDGRRADAAQAGVTRFVSATLLPQSYKRCERCWTWRPTVRTDLCDRCREVVAHTGP
jgi:hypothetical protein